MSLRVGDKLNGYCGGEFDSCDDKRVEAVGADWVVARGEQGDVLFASGIDVVEELWTYCSRNPNYDSMEDESEYDMRSSDEPTIESLPISLKVPCRRETQQVSEPPSMPRGKGNVPVIE